jgi:hypothetical protein
LITEIKTRRRLNLKQNARGGLYWDITVELFNKSNKETVKAMQDLKEQVEKAFGDKKQ